MEDWIDHELGLVRNKNGKQIYMQLTKEIIQQTLYFKLYFSESSKSFNTNKQ